MNQDLHLLDELQDKIGYRYQDPELLVRALTHSSYANERHMEHNERLEFLGDAVLELCISNVLFFRFPRAPEGHLTRLRAALVSEPTLARLARSLTLGDYIFLGRGEELQGGRDRDSVLADTLEAILGAVYLDSGYDGAFECIAALFEDFIPDRVEALPVSKDFKSRLQEKTQGLFRARPVYTLIDSYGPEHEKIYRVQVELPDGTGIEAMAGSVKKAEQKAASKALEYLDSVKTADVR
nr:ribonuclease III [Desulfonatronospira thiodismutans]